MKPKDEFVSIGYLGKFCQKELFNETIAELEKIDTLVAHYDLYLLKNVSACRNSNTVLVFSSKNED